MLLVGPLREQEAGLFGLIGKMTAKPGRRDALIALVLDGVETMPGCLSYVVAKDPANENDIWITEVWNSEADHKASLSLPSVTAAITRAMPLIDMEADGLQQKTIPVGGKGI
ncbi:putative quinol monooxygenase [Brevundimonas sp.]|uniref:putative quinol monooxygenase n=1 Tax=Brevundimonas sp. TaxID=1871086 RepID=UPI003917E91F